MSSARVNITNNYSCGGTYGIDRSFPAMLSNSMISEHEWNMFCDQVDSSIQPLNRLRYILLGGMSIVFVTFVVVMIAFVASMTSSFNSNCMGFSDCGGSSGPSPAIFFTIPLVVMVLMIGLSCYVQNGTREGLLKIQNLCEEQSAKYDKLSFHLRDDRIVVGGGAGYYNGSSYGGGYRTYHNVYIEISMANIPVHATVTMTQAQASIPTVSATPVVSSNSPFPDPELGTTTTQSVQGRLEELEKVRHFLTHEEYNTKRKEILADM